MPARLTLLMVVLAVFAGACGRADPPSEPPDQTPEGRLNRCFGRGVSQLDQAQCRAMEEAGVLCDDGYPFCGDSEVPARRQEYCEFMAQLNLVRSDPGKCAAWVQTGQLCSNGMLKEPHNDLGPSCSRYGEGRS